MTVEIGITLDAKQLQYSEAWLFWPQSWWGFSWWCWTSNYWEMWQKMDKNGRRLGSFQLVKQLLQKANPYWNCGWPLKLLNCLPDWFLLDNSVTRSVDLLIPGPFIGRLSWILFELGSKQNFLIWREKFQPIFPLSFFASDLLKMSIHFSCFSQTPFRIIKRNIHTFCS